MKLNNFPIFALLIISLFSCTKKVENFKEGDIIFQTSRSRQSPLIALATLSNKTHCGIIVEKNTKLYVLEASSKVCLTPIDKFIAKGENGTYQVKRYTNKPMKIKYDKYLGQKYDLAFQFDNGKMYCSELVYIIYKDQFNIELCKPRPIKSYHVRWSKKVQSAMRNRGISLRQEAVAPSDLWNSKYLFLIKLTQK